MSSDRAVLLAKSAGVKPMTIFNDDSDGLLNESREATELLDNIFKNNKKVTIGDIQKLLNYLEKSLASYQDKIDAFRIWKSENNELVTKMTSDVQIGLDEIGIWLDLEMAHRAERECRSAIRVNIVMSEKLKGIQIS